MDKRHFVYLYIILMIIFALIFFLAYFGLQRKESIFGIRGLPAEFEDWMIMILCVGSIIKIVFELSVVDRK